MWNKFEIIGNRDPNVTRGNIALPLSSPLSHGTTLKFTIFLSALS